MNGNYILNISKLCKKYKSGKGIRNINLDIAEGTMVGVVGLNGAGKTTLLSTIIGDLDKDSGSITYRFGKVESTELEVVLLNDVGIVMRDQGFPDHFSASVIDKIMSRIYRNWDSEEYFGLLNTFSIDPKKKFKQYSTGMKSAVSLIIALSHNAKLLVLDEITEGLDILARNKVRDLLFDFVENGQRTVLFTTHELGELEKIADSIIIIHQGSVFINVSKDDFLYKYKLFKVTDKQFAEIDKQDIISYKKEEYFVTVLPQDTKEFTEKYKIDSSWSSIEKIFEILLEGEKDGRLNNK